MPTYEDGSYSTAKLIRNVVSYPFPWPNNSTTKRFDLEYVQTAAAYVAASLGSTSGDAPNAYLVDHGPVEKIAPGFVRYRRSYCEIPVTWAKTEQIAYSFPGLSGGSGANWSPSYFRAPITLYAIATVTHSFTQGATSPSLNNTFIVTDNGNVVDYIGVSNPNYTSVLTSPSVEPANYTVSSDSGLLIGLIWEKVDVTVPKPV